MADRDILIGPGRLYVAPIGESNPDETTVAFGAAWGGNWVDLGDFVEGSGITLSIGEDVFKAYTELSTALKNAVRTRREVMVKATLAEHSVTNMAYVLDGTAATTAAGGSQKGYSDIPFGSNADIDFYKFGIEATRKDASDNNQPVRWFLHKGFFQLAGDIPYTKGGISGVPVEINIMSDGTQSTNEELGTLQIVTAAATS